MRKLVLSLGPSPHIRDTGVGAGWVRGAGWRHSLPPLPPQDEFDTLRRLCYPKADVFLLCFSVVAPTSFQNVGEKWVPELCRLRPTAPLLLVGTQCDLRQDVQVLIQLARRREKPVAEPAARALAQKVGAVGYVECSALTQQNLKEVFDTAILAGLRHAEARGRRARSTASKVRALSKAWWKKYVCVR